MSLSPKAKDSVLLNGNLALWHGVNMARAASAVLYLPVFRQGLGGRGAEAMYNLHSSHAEIWWYSGDGVRVQAFVTLPESKGWGGTCNTNPDFLLCVPCLEGSDLPPLSRAPFPASDLQACLSPFQSCLAILQDSLASLVVFCFFPPGCRPLTIPLPSPLVILN